MLLELLARPFTVTGPANAWLPSENETEPEVTGALWASTTVAVNVTLSPVNEGLDGAVQSEHGYDVFFAELLRIQGEILLRREAVTAAEDTWMKFQAPGTPAALFGGAGHSTTLYGRVAMSGAGLPRPACSPLAPSPMVTASTPITSTLRKTCIACSSGRNDRNDSRHYRRSEPTPQIIRRYPEAYPPIDHFELTRTRTATVLRKKYRGFVRGARDHVTE